GADLGAAAALAKNRYIAWIASKGSYVVVHPAQRQDDVELTDIAGIGEVWMEIAQIEIAHRIEPMVQRHDHHIAAADQRAAVVGRSASRALGKAATVQPHHYRALAPTRGVRGVDIEEQAVLAVRLGHASPEQRQDEAV